MSCDRKPTGEEFALPANRFQPERITLVFQGGGALGAYQVGVYKALDEAGYHPHWFVGTSIGAVNAAIIAGNAPGKRLAKLNEFWELISRPGPFSEMRSGGYLRRLMHQWNVAFACLMGQPNFFRPRLNNPWLAAPGTPDAVSFYDNDALRETLHRVIDMDRINTCDVRLSLGAVHVGTGIPVYFDNTKCPLTFDHILASTALPPSFPPVSIENAAYWDCGVVSNTPISVVLDDEPEANTLCFMIDLFNSNGELPDTMDKVLGRYKDIVYASRSDWHIEHERRINQLRRAVARLWEALPAEARTDDELKGFAELGRTCTMHIVHCVYRSKPYESVAKDYEFSRASIADHERAGYADIKPMLVEKPWNAPPPTDEALIVHECSTRAVVRRGIGIHRSRRGADICLNGSERRGIDSARQNSEVAHATT
jgi:NTE family protein